MHLNNISEYALRSVVFLAEKQGIYSTSEIAQNIKVPPKYMPGVMKNLISSGIIGSKEGRNGGYFLARRPEEISLHDIFTATETTFCISSCVEEAGTCSLNQKENCKIRKFYIQLQAAIREELEKETIDKLL